MPPPSKTRGTCVRCKGPTGMGNTTGYCRTCHLAGVPCALSREGCGRFVRPDSKSGICGHHNEKTRKHFIDTYYARIRAGG